MVNDFEIGGVIVSFKDEMAATLATAQTYLAHAKTRTVSPIKRVVVDRDEYYALMEYFTDDVPSERIPRLDEHRPCVYHAPNKTSGLLEED